MIDRHKLIKALNVAFDETKHSEYRQRMAACLLDQSGNIMSVGHNTKNPYFWMRPENGYRKDQRGSHCELDAIRNYVADRTYFAPLHSKAWTAWTVNEDGNKKPTKEDEEAFFEYVKSLKIAMIVVARRKGGLLSDTRGSSKPCRGCWKFLCRCGIKSVVYYDEDNHFVEETLS